MVEQRIVLMISSVCESYLVVIAAAEIELMHFDLEVVRSNGSGGLLESDLGLTRLLADCTVDAPYDGDCRLDDLLRCKLDGLLELAVRVLREFGAMFSTLSVRDLGIYSKLVLDAKSWSELSVESLGEAATTLG